MEGPVLRRRENLDWLWTERYLVLRGSTLMVFKKKGDPSPSRTVFLSRDCWVAEIPSHDDKYFEFKIAFSGSAHSSVSSGTSESDTVKAVHFATRSREDMQRWVRAVEDALQRMRYVEAEAEQETAPSIAQGLEYTPAQIQNILNKSSKSKRTEEVADKDNTSSTNVAADDDPSGGVAFLRDGEWEVVDADGGIALYRHSPGGTLRNDLARHAAAYNRLVTNGLAIFVLSSIIASMFSPRPLSSYFPLVLLVAAGVVLVYVRKHFYTLLIDKDLPQYLASTVVRGSPTDVFRELTSGDKTHWMVPFANGEEIEQINQFASVCYHQVSPAWTAAAYARPRDIVLLRYWRQEEDGSYFVIFQSTSHAKAPPRPGFVRASVPLSALIIIPQRPEKAGRGNPQSLVTVMLGFDPNGWGSVWAKYMNSLVFIKPVVASLVAFRDKMQRLDFIDPRITIEPSSGNVQAAVGVDDQGLVVGVKTLPCSCPKKFWAEPDASLFEVRGPTYLSDRKKVPAQRAAFHLVAVDMLSFEDPSQRYNLGSRPDNLIAEIEKRALEAGTPVPFTFIVNMVIPCALNLSAVCYYQPASPNWREDDDRSFLDLFSDFIDGDDSFRNNRFKLIPTIVDGSFVLRKALGARPAIIGNKGLRVPYYRGENWFEVDIDVDSDTQARNITGMVIGATKSLTVDIAFLIESQTQEELPEKILGTVRFIEVDTSVCKRIAKDLPTTRPASTVPAPAASTPQKLLASPVRSASVAGTSSSTATSPTSVAPAVTLTTPSRSAVAPQLLTPASTGTFTAPTSPASSPASPQRAGGTRHSRSLSNTPILSRFSKDSRQNRSQPSIGEASMPDLGANKKETDPKELQGGASQDLLRKSVNMKDVLSSRKGLTVHDALRATSDLAHAQVTRGRSHSHQ